MKNTIFVLCSIAFSTFANAFAISNVTVSALNSNDINIAVIVGNGSTFEMDPPSYYLSGNTITVNICCYFGGFTIYTYLTANQIISGVNTNVSNYNLVVNVREIISALPCSMQPLRSTATMNFGTPLSSAVVLTSNSFVAQKANVYPNPNHGVFTVKSLQNFDLKIYDILGHELFDKKNINESLEIQSNLSKGVYLLKVFNKDGTTAASKFVVE